MLLELSIKNFAIIEDVRIEFGNGLNVLSGETGSGKSIIIDALSMVLGQRTNKDVIKHGKDFAYIEAIFTCYEQLDDLEELEIESGDLIIISKEIKHDRPAISKVNGKTVNNSSIVKITSKLIDIFAQQESISLMQNSNQRDLLDKFAGAEQKLLLERLKYEVNELKNLKLELEEKSKLEHEREREIDLLKYQIQEIEDANLTQYDEEELELDYKKISNSTEIISELSKAIQIINNYEDVSIEALIDSLISTLVIAKKYDSSIDSDYNEVEDIRYRIKEVYSNLENYVQKMDFDPQKMMDLENRLNLVNSLKKKYGNNIIKINQFLDESSNRLDFLENFERKINELKLEIEEKEKHALSIAQQISENRKKVAETLESKVKKELLQLAINGAEFRVDILDKQLAVDGIDSIEYMIKTNIGEDFKPLSKTASGGEMSRIMLGFKSILAEQDNIQTLIFDEIDTGISGITAEIVGNKIKTLSKDRQIIAISHLQQIVSLADHHFLIEKSSDNNSTISTVKKLNKEERIKELARLIGGMNITETALNAAKELISKGEIDG